MGRAKKNVEVEAQVIARGNVVPMMTEPFISTTPNPPATA